MSGGNAFWFCAGALVASGLAFVLPSIWRAMAGRSRLGTLAAVSGIAAVLIVASVGLYGLLGDPLAADRSAVAAGVPHAMQAQAGSGQPSGLDAATRKLAARLQSNGGADSEWELLAQSYDYMGDAAAASEARAHRVAASAATQEPVQQRDESVYRQRIAKNPRDVAAWLALAQMARTQRHFPDAKTAYDQVIALHGMNADGWADYADVLATTSGKLSGAPAAALAKALALDAKHTKALWLQASLALEERRYKDALADWQRLRGVIDDTSPDARIVDANIKEAELLAGESASMAKTIVGVQSNAPAVIRGSVEIDPSLRARITQDMTLFIYAKAIDKPGPPLAVLRTRPSNWPLKFQLDDSLAMMPDRQLSGFDKVIVEARLSKSGQAMPQPGDLQALSDVVGTRDARVLTLRIKK